MSFVRLFSEALSRTVQQTKAELAKAARMETSPRTHGEYGRILLYTITSPDDLSRLAKGCDSDMGGASQMKLELDPQEGKGRFYGTLSTEVPPKARLERSGYAAFRNKGRPTLFGMATWDTSFHPFLRLRVRNPLAPPAQSLAAADGTPSTTFTKVPQQALQPPPINGKSTFSRAVHALGLDRGSEPGPKFFVNLQDDGPVTSDVYQHRLLLDERKGNAWQDVILPLKDFVLMNAGEVSEAQLEMMCEKVRTVGISVVLEPPVLGEVKPMVGEWTDAGNTKAHPDVLKSRQTGDAATPIGEARGSRRGVTYRFDLGVEKLEFLSKEALQEEGLGHIAVRADRED